MILAGVWLHAKWNWRLGYSLAKTFDFVIKPEIMRYILWFALIKDAAYFSFIQNL